MVHQLLAWDQAPQSWGYAAKRRNVEKKSASEASRAGDWEREGAAEPGDMLFMPPINDTRFWYHALISQSVQC